MSNTLHTPVLVKEVLLVLSPVSGDSLLDATIGHGGHARAYLTATEPAGTVLGFDADPAALAIARQQLQAYGDRVRFVESSFSQLKDSVLGGGILQTEGPPMFSHILFDLGIGSHQLGDTSRGFSFASPGPLTMAYGKLQRLPAAQLESLNSLERHLGYLPDAADILRGLAKSDLVELITFYGEERYARRVASAIKRSLPITTAKHLAEVIEEALPGAYEHGRLHPATRTFQALRLAVNRELESLAAALPQAVDLLKVGGVLAVISFHSLEDRIVKQFFRSRKGELEIATKKPIRASQEEIRENPRSRSARLRAAKKS